MHTNRSPHFDGHLDVAGNRSVNVRAKVVWRYNSEIELLCLTDIVGMGYFTITSYSYFMVSASF